MSTNAQLEKVPASLPIKSVVFQYDYSVHGGAVGSIGTNIFIPSSSHVTKVYFEKFTAFTSGGSATVAVTLVSAGDLLAATAYNNAIFTANIGTGIPTGTPATMVKNTNSTETEVLFTIATAALTAGKYNIHIEYK